MGFAQKFGKSLKGIVVGMIIGVICLPIGVFCQYKAANQMKYHKFFKKSKIVTSPSEVKKSTNINTTGSYTFSDINVPYDGSSLKSYGNDSFTGKFITYSIDKYKIKYERIEKKDSEGKVTYEDKYEWILIENVGKSPDSTIIKVNGFSSELDDFEQNFLNSASQYYLYTNDTTTENSQQSYGLKNINGLNEGSKPFSSSELKKLYDKYGANLWSYELNGYKYEENQKTITICGLSDSSGKLQIIPGPAKGKMLTIGYESGDAMFDKLKKTAKTEGLMKFIVGAIIFMIGFSLLFSPFIKLIDMIPFIGNMAVGVIYVIMAFFALIISALFWFFFKFWWLLLILAIGIPLIIVLISVIVKKNKASA